MMRTPVSSPWAPAAGCRADSGESGDLLEPFLQLIHQRQIPLHRFDRLERMSEGKSGQIGQYLR